MIFRNKQAREESSANQLLELYSDKDHTKLFGWLSTYISPENPLTIIENWALVDAEDVNLWGTHFYSVIVAEGASTPSNIEEWLQVLEKGPEFRAFIERKANPAGVPVQFASLVPAFDGSIVYGIYNSDSAIEEGNLVSVTLQEEPVTSNEIVRFNQVSVMSTMEAELPCFIYSGPAILPEPLNSPEFIKNKGIKGLELPEDQPALVVFEKVITGVKSYSEIPSDK